MSGYWYSVQKNTLYCKLILSFNLSRDKFQVQMSGQPDIQSYCKEQDTSSLCQTVLCRSRHFSLYPLNISKCSLSCDNHKHPTDFHYSSTASLTVWFFTYWFQKQGKGAIVEVRQLGRLGSSPCWWICLKILSLVKFFFFLLSQYFSERTYKSLTVDFYGRLHFLCRYGMEVEWLSRRKLETFINTQKEI